MLGVPGEAEEAGVAGVAGVEGVVGAGGGDRGVGTALNTSAFYKTGRTSTSRNDLSGFLCFYSILSTLCCRRELQQAETNQTPAGPKICPITP